MAIRRGSTPTIYGRPGTWSTGPERMAHSHSHAHDHSHGHQHQHHGRAHQHDHGNSTRALTWSLVLTVIILFAEGIGGWLSNSLALLADAGHVLTDAGA